MKASMLDLCLRTAQNINPGHTEPYRHFSFVVQYDTLMAHGKNRSGPPLVHLGYPEHGKIHSETEAYRKATNVYEFCRGEPWQIVNIRLNKSGVMRSSKPCVCCYNFLRSVNCDEVWFTTDVGFARMTL